MAELTVAIIGCGRTDEGKTGCAIGHRHAEGYRASPDVRFVAFCDIVPANAEAFRAEHGAGDERLYTDYREMLARERPDVVSVATWPALHAPMTIACAEAGVRAVHCEKPMALTYGDARRMAAACEASGTQLTFNHQRRFIPTFRKTRELAAGGAIGELRQIQSYTSNLYDWGTHWFDMAFFLNGETPAEWVLGQIDLRGRRTVFGAPVEGQGLARVKFANGVFLHMVTGHDAPHEVAFRLLGSDGVIEVPDRADFGLRMMNGDAPGWQTVMADAPIHGEKYLVVAVLDLIDALEDGREPELSARKALQATEVLFAVYESARRRARVDLPLAIDDSPLQALIDEHESG